MNFSDLKPGDVLTCRAQLQSAKLRQMTEDDCLGVNSVQVSEAYATLQQKDIESAVAGDQPFIMEVGLDASITREAQSRGHYTANPILGPVTDRIDQLAACGAAVDVVRSQKPFSVFVSSNVPNRTFASRPERSCWHEVAGCFE